MQAKILSEVIPTLTINSNTGEIISQGEYHHREDAKTKRRVFRKYWLGNMAFPMDNIKAITAGSDFHVLFAMIKHLEMNNYVNVTNTRIAQTAGVAPKNVSINLKRLEQAGFIYRPEGQRSGWRLNPAFIWHGFSDDHPKKEIAGGDWVKAKRKGSRSLLAQTDKQSHPTEA